jgi:hypothetical protein
MNLNKEFVDLFYVIMKPYNDIEIEKFKYADLLKDEKEMEKKRLRSPKTVKTEIREKAILIMKTYLNKNAIFDVKNENNNKINEYIPLFEESILKEFIHEKEQLRKLFSDFYYQFLVKFFCVNKTKIDLKSDTPKCNMDIEFIKKLINDYEDYFIEEVFDSSLDVRQTCINILNMIICLFDKNQYYDAMCRMFTDFKNEKDFQKFNFESLKVLAYTEEESKKINSIFKDFKNIFSIIINLYIDEKSSFGNLCEAVVKNSLEKFPIFCFNEYSKAKNKGQMTRTEILDRMLNKYLKIK